MRNLAIGIAAGCIDIIESPGSMPIEDSNFRLTQPPKWAGGNGLIGAIDTHGVMSSRAAKPVAPFRVRNVGIRSGIDEKLLIIQAGNDAESIAMSVTCRARTEAAGAKDRLELLTPYHSVPAIGKQRRDTPVRPNRRHANEFAASLHRGACEACPRTIWMQETPAIIVSHQGQRPVGSRN